MTPAMRRRLRAAVLALPVSQRKRHLSALACLMHLVEHVTEDREPVQVTLGREVEHSPALRWAAAQLGYSVAVCVDPACADPAHVTLETRPIAAVGAAP